MAQSALALKLLMPLFGILKLSAMHPFPTWLADVSPYFVARTEDEFSVMCPQAVIPAELTYSGGWRCLRVHSSLAFDEVGVAVTFKIIWRIFCSAIWRKAWSTFPQITLADMVSGSNQGR